MWGPLTENNLVHQQCTNRLLIYTHTVLYYIQNCSVLAHLGHIKAKYYFLPSKNNFWFYFRRKNKIFDLVSASKIYFYLRKQRQTFYFARKNKKCFLLFWITKIYIFILL